MDGSTPAGMWLCVLVLLSSVSASEFPERECCDALSPTASVSPYYDGTTAEGFAAAVETRSGQSGREASHSGPDASMTSNHIGAPKSKTSAMWHNCLHARTFCFNDPACASILEVIPSLCGPELVSCSTVTVSRCQAALKTLQAYPDFSPTCLCKEPVADRECNFFRDFLYDHPCNSVSKKESDPYPMETLPTCNHAFSVCNRDTACRTLYMDFKAACKVHDGKCRMEDRDRCFDAWVKMRRTPIFGCICPNDRDKKKCDRIFRVMNHNKCVGYDAVNLTNAASRDLSSSNIVEPEAEAVGTSETALQTTCQTALDNCFRKYSCKKSLLPVIRNCDPNKCSRRLCLESIQSFYRTIETNISHDIAFCLCKRHDRTNGCLEARAKLHPVCAQNAEPRQPVPQCSALPNMCRDNKTCAAKLERYVQACAVDSLTRRCAGPQAECRKAIVGIMGTPLKFGCVCVGSASEVRDLYECLGWQRVLWINPCVVEASKSHHQHLALTTTAAPEKTSRAPPPLLTFITEAPLEEEIPTPSAFTTSTMTPAPPPPEPLTTTPAPTTTPSTTTTVSTTVTTMVAITSVATSTSTSSTPATTTTPKSTTVTTTTTEQIKYCVLQRQQQTRHSIREGTGKRFPRYDEPECSEVCHCQLNDTLVCNTVCVQRSPCRTEYAFYNHASPAYQAYRGRCVCFSGRFICMRPPQESYSLPEGVFLFIGYSEREEALLQKYTNLSIYDVASALQEQLQQSSDVEDGSPICTLLLHNVTRENLILVVKLLPNNGSEDSTGELVRREKEECENPLLDLVEKINKGHTDFNSHLLLSILKLGVVDTKLPERTSSATPLRPDFLASTATAIFLGALAARIR